MLKEDALSWCQQVSYAPSAWPEAIILQLQKGKCKAILVQAWTDP